jgi:hypothetical protein
MCALWLDIYSQWICVDNLHAAVIFSCTAASVPTLYAAAELYTVRSITDKHLTHCIHCMYVYSTSFQCARFENLNIMNCMLQVPYREYNYHTASQNLVAFHCNPTCLYRR